MTVTCEGCGAERSAECICHLAGLGEGDEPLMCPTGMTLRDWFAGQALAGMLAWDGYARPKDPGEITADVFARSSYELADAMMAARDAGLTR